MKVKLWNDKREREMFNSFADLYAIIKMMEKLDKAYVCDLVSSFDYESECLKLIAQFKTLSSFLRDVIPSIECFAKAYKMDCPAALNQLLVPGVLATVEHRSFSFASNATSAAAVAECVQHFITTIDLLELNMVVVDQVHPLLVDLSSSLAKLETGILPSDFEGKAKMREWIARLAKIKAAHELAEQ